MNFDQITHARLLTQQIAASDFTTPRDLVAYLGAVQAQDYSMSKWAVGLRLPGFRETGVEEALNRGDLLRTHILRPTWHIVAADDIQWMLQLTAPRIIASGRSRWRELGLDEEVFKKSRRILERTLAAGPHLTREELMKEISMHIPVFDQRAAHLMIRAELDGLVCSGVPRQNKQTYALLEDRVKVNRTFSQEEALAELARRYFQSHGPATAGDFSWWSGLALTQAKKAVELIKGEFETERIGEKDYCFHQSVTRKLSAGFDEEVFFLPAYDEFIISYKDRSPSLAADQHQKAIGSNGFFRPVIVVGGKVAGTWARNISKDKVSIRCEFFDGRDEADPIVREAAMKFARYLEKELMLAGE